MLGVGGEQVRRYVARGLLPATKIANAWVLPVAHVAAFREGRPRDGRPLSQEAAWACIVAGDVDLDNPHRYANCGALSRWMGTSGAVADFMAREDIVVSGTPGAKGTCQPSRIGHVCSTGGRGAGPGAVRASKRAVRSRPNNALAMTSIPAVTLDTDRRFTLVHNAIKREGSARYLR